MSNETTTYNSENNKTPYKDQNTPEDPGVKKGETSQGGKWVTRVADAKVASQQTSNER